MSFPNKPRIYKWNGWWYCQAKRPNRYHASGYTNMLGPGRSTPQLAYQGWYEWYWSYLPSQLKLAF